MHTTRDQQQPVIAAIFDVDGVIVDSPHEQAWREALQGFADPQKFTTAIYQSHVAGKPRMSGARAALEQLGVPDAAAQAPAYAERKQKRLEELIAAERFSAFPDALRFIQAIRAHGIRLAAASSSKNANQMMARVRLESGTCLLDMFDANLSGRDVKRGKPDPELFLLAASELAVAPAECLVVEDAPSGLEAAKAGGMVGLGVARVGDVGLLRAAGANLVVTSLDDVAIEPLAAGRISLRPIQKG